MTYAVFFRSEAEDEARAARRWYEEQKPGLGSRFTDAIDDTVSRIALNPAAFPIVHAETRRAVVRQFPFGIYFQIRAESVVILAVMHGRRHPHRWQIRS